MQAILVKRFEFEAAQSLSTFPAGHKCRQMHGHSFSVEVSVKGTVDPKTGIVYDHAKISEAMAPLVQVCDHAYLNDIEGLEIPTIELMAKWFWDRLSSRLPGLYEIKIVETPRAWCVYRGE